MPHPREVLMFTWLDKIDLEWIIFVFLVSLRKASDVCPLVLAMSAPLAKTNTKPW